MREKELSSYDEALLRAQDTLINATALKEAVVLRDRDRVVERISSIMPGLSQRSTMLRGKCAESFSISDCGLKPHFNSNNLTPLS